MKLVVNMAACDGFGFCHEVLPEVIALDEWGYPIVSGEVPVALVPTARHAVRACPRRAVALLDTESHRGRRHRADSAVSIRKRRWLVSAR